MSIFIEGLEKWQHDQAHIKAPKENKTKTVPADQKAASRLKNIYQSFKDVDDKRLEHAGNGEGSLNRSPDLPRITAFKKSGFSAHPDEEMRRDSNSGSSAENDAGRLSGMSRNSVVQEKEKNRQPSAPATKKPHSRFILRGLGKTRSKAKPKGSAGKGVPSPKDVQRKVVKEEAVPQAQHRSPPPLEEGYLVAATRKHEREMNARIPAVKSRVEINLNWLKSLGMVTPDMSNARIVEEFRNIKRPVLTKAFETAGYLRNLVVVTSALQGEGKTFTALNLALSVAMERDKHVLLVDTDIEHGGLTKLLKLGQFIGLRDYLEDPKIKVDDLIVHSNVPSLSLIPVGETHPDAAESLASSRMTSLLADLSRRYPDRLVILDSSPLLVSSAASIVAQMADQRLIVFAADETPSELLDQVVSKLANVEDTGIILNKSHPDSSKGLYGYGHYGTYSDA